MEDEIHSRQPDQANARDDAWAFAAPSLTRMMPPAPQRDYEARSVFSTLRWIASGCFEATVRDLRAILR